MFGLDISSKKALKQIGVLLIVRSRNSLIAKIMFKKKFLWLTLNVVWLYFDCFLVESESLWLQSAKRIKGSDVLKTFSNTLKSFEENCLPGAIDAVLQDSCEKLRSANTIRKTSMACASCMRQGCLKQFSSNISISQKKHLKQLGTRLCLSANIYPSYELRKQTFFCIDLTVTYLTRLIILHENTNTENMFCSILCSVNFYWYLKPSAKWYNQSLYSSMWATMQHAWSVFEIWVRCICFKVRELVHAFVYVSLSPPI